VASYTGAIVHISNSIQSPSHRPFQSVMHINFICILCWGGGEVMMVY
jgi:hypothetical protein